MFLRIMGNKSMKEKILAISLIFQVIYFTQIYPYAHIHHAHQGGELDTVLSVHPVDVHPRNHEGLHPDGHHHDAEDHLTADRTFLGRRVSNEPPKRGAACLLSILPSSAWVATTISSDFNRSYSSFWFPENRFLLPQTSRGPPSIS